MATAMEVFRDWISAEHRNDGSLEGVQVLEGADAPEGGLSVRLLLGKKSYYEIRLPEGAPHVQVGFATEARMINEEIEESILENGGDLSELLADELCDLGDEPIPMEHFFERPAFRYTVRLPLATPDDLQYETLRKRIGTVLKACRILFQEAVDEG